MSWTDKCAIETIKKLRDFYKVKDLVETGTFMGINAKLHAQNFEYVLTCESVKKYYEKAKKKLKKNDNVIILNLESKKFLREFVKEYKKSGRKDKIIFYLDAHFYNPKGPRWVVRDELKVLKNFKNAIVIIHDFNNGLGHCIYDGERLGMNVLGKLLKKVNPNFHYYTNNLDYVDIVKPGEMMDKEAEDNVKYLWKTPRLTYRGILYCVPTKLSKDFKLVKWKQ